MKEIVNDSVYSWTDDEFQVLVGQIDLKSAKRKSDTIIDDLENEILILMNSTKEEKKLKRLKELYTKIQSN
jgi:hypothetical protein